MSSNNWVSWVSSTTSTTSASTLGLSDTFVTISARDFTALTRNQYKCRDCASYFSAEKPNGLCAKCKAWDARQGRAF